MAVWRIRRTFVVENETKHYKTMKRQIATQVKADLRNMSKKWAAGKTFWSRYNYYQLFVVFPKDSPLTDAELKTQGILEAEEINNALVEMGCTPIRIQFRKRWF